MANKTVRLRQIGTDFTVTAIMGDPVTWAKLRLTMISLFSQSCINTLPAEEVAPGDVFTFNVTVEVADMDH